MASPKIRVILADDHFVVRMGVAAALAAEPDLEVVGESADGLEVRSLARDLKPDVIVMDIMMPKVNGAEATQAILSDLPSMRILILTSFDAAPEVRTALEAGAAGALLKTSPPDAIIEAIRVVARGGSAICPEIARLTRGGNPLPRLSSRQLEILSLAARGFTNGEIARMLGIGPNGVKGHLTKAYALLGVSGRTEAVSYALDLGLIRH